MKTTIEIIKTTESSLLSVNDAKCKKCGTCIEVCPDGIISMSEILERPVILKRDESSCIHCGHCAAICPAGSLNHQSSPLEESAMIQKKLLPKSEQLEHLLKSRRSIRVFKQKPVEKEKIFTIINTAIYAPTGCNSQAVEWIVINNKDTIKKVKDLVIEWMKNMLSAKHEFASEFEKILKKVENDDVILRNAPALVIAQAGQGALTGVQDVDIALSHFEITALAYGLGTCWAGLLTLALQDYKPLRKKLDLNGFSCYAMMLGYPKFSFRRQPKRKQAKIILK